MVHTACLGEQGERSRPRNLAFFCASWRTLLMQIESMLVPATPEFRRDLPKPVAMRANAADKRRARGLLRVLRDFMLLCWFLRNGDAYGVGRRALDS